MNSIQIPGVAFPVSEFCLGCAYIGTKQNREESFAILDYYFEHGGRFLNTAHEYGFGKSEEAIGQWLRSRKNRDQMILTTKGGEANWRADMHREALLQDMDESLIRLGLDYVDFYMLHLDDESIGVDELLETLEEMRKAGKLRHYGCSNWSADRQRDAAAYAKAHGIQGFVIDEIEFNLAGRMVTNEDAAKWLDQKIADLHREDGICVGAYSPLVSGALSKLVRDGDTRNWNSYLSFNYDNPYTREVGRRLSVLCEETGHTAAQLQLAWLLNHPYGFPTFLITGVSSTQQLADSMITFDVEMTPEMIRYLRPDPEEFPTNNPDTFLPRI